MTDASRQDQLRLIAHRRLWVSQARRLPIALSHKASCGRYNRVWRCLKSRNQGPLRRVQIFARQPRGNGEKQRANAPREIGASSLANQF